jgi:hypothetical protein
MLKRIVVKKIGLGLILSIISLLCGQSQASIISSFSAGVDFAISSSASQNTFGTDLFDEQVFVQGSASGSNNGIGVSALNILGANEGGNVNASADGQVDGIEGFVQSSWESEGYFYFENATGSDISVDVIFDITWFANIFTSSSDEEAYATAGVFIENSAGDRVFWDYIELDSLIQGVGSFSYSDSFVANFNINLANGDFEEYYIIVDSFGFAENLQQVPEPGVLLLVCLALLFMVRKQKFKA